MILHKAYEAKHVNKRLLTPLLKSLTGANGNNRGIEDLSEQCFKDKTM